MPFQPGNKAGAGHPKKGTSLKELLRNHPIKDKRKLVQKAYELALAGDVRWAEWIARTSGEGAEAAELPPGAQVRRIVIEEVRYGDDEPPDALDAGSGDVNIPLPPRSAGDVE